MYEEKNTLNVVIGSQNIVSIEGWFSKWKKRVKDEKFITQEELWIENRSNLPGFKAFFYKYILEKSNLRSLLLLLLLHYLTSKWKPGLLSNWDKVAKSRITKVNCFMKKKRLFQKKRLSKRQKRYKIETRLYLIKFFGGFRGLKKLPGLAMFSNLKANFQAVIECKVKKFSTVALLDLNDNPININFAVSLNRNSMLAWKILFYHLTKVITRKKKLSTFKIAS